MNKKMWFQSKKVWWWIIGILAVITILINIMTFASIRGVRNSVTRTRSSSGNTTTMTTTQSGGTTDSKDSLNLNNKSYKYTEKKVYNVNKTDSSWTDYADLTIKDITIYRLSSSQKIGYSGDTGNTIVVFNVSVNAKKDVDPLLNISTLSVNGKQAEASTVRDDNITGDINAGVTKEGKLYYIFDSSDSLSNFTKGLRWKGEIYPADSNDNNTKEYDLTIDLD